MAPRSSLVGIALRLREDGYFGMVQTGVRFGDVPLVRDAIGARYAIGLGATVPRHG